MKQRQTFTYVCPECKFLIERQYEPICAICDNCKYKIPEADMPKCWQSTATILGKSEGGESGIMYDHANQRTNGITYWVGGVRMNTTMSFDAKINQVMEKFPCKAVEIGHGYAVIEYPYAHGASQTAGHLREYSGPHDDWLIDTNGPRLAIVDRNWTQEDKTKTEEEDKNNESYAG